MIEKGVCSEFDRTVQQFHMVVSSLETTSGMIQNRSQTKLAGITAKLLASNFCAEI